MNRTFLGAATVLMISSGAAEAATVTLSYLHRVQGNDDQTEASEVITIADTTQETDTTFTLDVTTVPSSGPELERAQSFASVDVLTGAMKASVNMASTIDPPGPGLNGYPGSASTSAALVAPFVVTGSGNVTFFLDVTGSWFTTSVNDAPNFYSASLRLLSFDGDGISNATDSPLNGSLSERFSVSGFLTDGLRTQIESSLTLIIPAGNKGQLDFSNTAFLSFVADPGVSLAFSDPDFLTAPPTTPIPLPTPVALLIFGVGAMLGLGRFRKTT